MPIDPVVLESRIQNLERVTAAFLRPGFASVMDSFAVGGTYKQVHTRTNTVDPPVFGWIDQDASGPGPTNPDTQSVPFITNITGGNVTLGYVAGTSPANKVVSSSSSDQDAVTVFIEVDGGSDGWQPTVTINAVAVTNLTRMGSDTRRFSGSAAITMAASGSIEVNCADGGFYTIDHVRETGPAILTATFGAYPGSQTAVKSGDTIHITGTCDADATTIYVTDFEASSALQEFTGITGGVFDITVTIGSRSGSDQHCRLYAKDSGGFQGANFDTTNTIILDQTTPTFGTLSVTYPAGPPQQEAIKSGEDAAVACTVTNWDAGTMSIVYSSPNSQVTIVDDEMYAASKTATYLAGSYNISTTNYRMTVTYAPTAKVATKDGVVWIANSAANVSVNSGNLSSSSSGSVLPRLGTDNGTVGYRDHSVYLNGDQRLLAAGGAVLTASKGAWQGSWTATDTNTWSRSLRIADAAILAGGQAANNGTFSALSVRNLANVETTAIQYNASYAIGGFQTRTLNMGPITGGDPPYTHTADIGVPVVNTTKCTVVNTSKGGTPAQTYEGNVTEHNDADSSLNNFWTTVAALAGESFDDYTRYFHCSDKKFYDSVTAPGGFNVTIAESA